MNTEAGKLVNICVQDGEGQSCRKLLAPTNVGLEDEAEIEAGQRIVVLKAGGHSTNAEIAQGAAGKYKTASGVNADITTIDQERETGTHRDR